MGLIKDVVDTYEHALGFKRKSDHLMDGIGVYKGRKYYKKPKSILGKTVKHLQDVGDIVKVALTGTHSAGYQAGLGANVEEPMDVDTVYADINQAAASLHDEGQKSTHYFNYDPEVDMELDNMDPTTIHGAAGRVLGMVKKHIFGEKRYI